MYASVNGYLKGLLMVRNINPDKTVIGEMIC